MTSVSSLCRSRGGWRRPEPTSARDSEALPPCVCASGYSAVRGAGMGIGRMAVLASHGESRSALAFRARVIRGRGVLRRERRAVNALAV